MMKEKLRRRGGFTLAELLIVVAIIAVLAAIVIPVFGTELEKAAEATDLANIRAAYAEVMVQAVQNPGENFGPIIVPLKQTVFDWSDRGDDRISATEEILKELTGDNYQGDTGNVSGGSVDYPHAEVQWYKPGDSGVNPGYCRIDVHFPSKNN